MTRQELLTLRHEMFALYQERAHLGDFDNNAKPVREILRALVLLLDDRLKGDQWLDDAIKLTHPDRHPKERQGTGQESNQRLAESKTREIEKLGYDPHSIV
jgi:hypothetical protein